MAGNKRKKTGKQQGRVPPEEHQFKPGESGNPAGRPPGVKNGLRAQLQALMNKKPPQMVLDQLQSRGIEGVDKADYAQAIAIITAFAAFKGEPWAVKVILEQTENPIVQKIAPTTPDGENPYSGASDEEICKLVKGLIDNRIDDGRSDDDKRSESADA